jgi:NhaA family Na+:H+ antiporter
MSRPSSGSRPSTAFSWDEFLRVETASGPVLLAATLVALAWANLGSGYNEVWAWPLTVGWDTFSIAKPVLLWINDFLMAIFFLLVALELKRELVGGQFATPGQALVPAVAALGGMIVPAAIFLLLTADSNARHGWAIPMATDIAFALACLRALGSRVPASLLVFLTAVAVVDDLGAIIVIALFFTAQVNGAALGSAVALTALLLALNYAGVRRPWLFVAVGLPLWVAVLKSGVHTTLAGVIVGLCVPADKRGTASPVETLEHALHPWVALLIVPVFALANAGVVVDAEAVSRIGDPLSLGIVLGLLVGKPVGVAGGTWVIIRSGAARLPPGLTWGHVFGASLLAGIGFTMALFIASLAFPGDPALFDQSRMAIVLASIASAGAGVTVLLISRRAVN